MSIEKINDNLESVKYQNTDNFFEDICLIINSAQNYVYTNVNKALVERNWLIGYRIADEELKGNNRAEYGEKLIINLSKKLTKQYGKGFDYRNLYRFFKFYKMFPNILTTVRSKSKILLSWTHYRILLQVNDEKARLWYENEAIKQMWSVRTLQRNISSQYYYRLLNSQLKQKIEKNEDIDQKNIYNFK